MLLNYLIAMCLSIYCLFIYLFKVVLVIIIIIKFYLEGWVLQAPPTIELTYFNKQYYLKIKYKVITL